MSYFDRLKEFMSSINPNVNWNNVLNETMNKPIEKIFSKLKTYLWTDKELNESTNQDPVNRNTFLYYTRLTCWLESKLLDENVAVIVVGEPAKAQQTRDNDTINEKVKTKLSILTKILTFKLIDFKILNDGNVDSVLEETNRFKRILMFPTCSIMYDKPNELINMFKNVDIVDDGYYNIYNSPAELEFDMIRLLVVELVQDPTLKIDELLSKKYGMLKCESNLLGFKTLLI